MSFNEKSSFYDIPIRPRRNRRTASIRALVRETQLCPGDLISPHFVIEGEGKREAISAMPGVERLSIDLLVQKAETLHGLGVSAMALFPALSDDLKNTTATESTNAEGLLQRTIRALKSAVPEMTIIPDVAMDPYSSDGHDGFVSGGQILNDPTLPILADMAVSQAKAGADIVAPSDMMDGRIGVIRDALDAHGFTDVGILSYAAKYASAFYGPFREALASSPRSGDKKTYQMDPANVREALREVELDIAEGADMVIVKPGLPYLDIIAKVHDAFDVPVCAYQVSGEYAMIKAAAEKGWIDETLVMAESLLSIKRAGADMMMTYYAEEAAKYFA